MERLFAQQVTLSVDLIFGSAGSNIYINCNNSQPILNQYLSVKLRK